MMDIEAKILHLTSKKLAKEANEDELNELNSLLSANPEICNSLKNIFDLWDIIDLNPNISEKEIEENTANVLMRIQQQISSSGKYGGVAANKNKL